MADWPLLSMLVWLPIVGGVVLLFMGNASHQAIRMTALVISVAMLLLSLPLWTQFDSQTAAMQFVELKPWISSLNANYHLGVDGISMPLILLTTFITVLVVGAAWEVIKEKPCLLYTSPSPRDQRGSRMPSSA